MKDDTPRGELLLGFIRDQVAQDLNPNDEECPFCGGEGATFDCFDGCCASADSGCQDCTRPCPECRMHEANITRAVRLEVLRTLDVDIAIAWLKSERKWSGSFTRDKVLLNLHAGRVAAKEFTDEERAASACWVEGLL